MRSKGPRRKWDVGVSPSKEWKSSLLPPHGIAEFTALGRRSLLAISALAVGSFRTSPGYRLQSLDERVPE
jgi:hypothetical protein